MKKIKKMKEKDFEMEQDLFAISKANRRGMIIFLAVMLALWCVPIYSLLKDSLKVHGLENYWYVLTNEVNGVPFYQYFINSIINAVFASALLVLICSFSADETGDLEFGVLWHHEFEYQQARLAGIEAAIAEKDPRIKLVDEQEGLVTEDGVKACEAWTQAFPNLKGVLATNDTCLLGYAQAWQAAGKDLKDENFGMFGNDGVNDAIDMVAEGSILRGDVGLDVYDGGAMALLACVKQLDGVETDSVILPMVSVTSENAEEDWISHPTLYVK